MHSLPRSISRRGLLLAGASSIAIAMSSPAAARPFGAWGGVSSAATQAAISAAQDAAQQAQQAAQHDEGEQPQHQRADHQAELLAHHGEHEVGVRVRQHVFDPALAGSAPER